MSGWTQAFIGAGGLISGINITTNAGGTSTLMLIRGDASGAHRFNNSTQKWEQLVTRLTMPATDVGAGLGRFLSGCYEICAAPSDNTRCYMAYNASNLSGYVFVSNDQGSTWARTAGWTGVTWDANTTNYKTMGPKMAVDPFNKDIVYIGTPSNGAFVTLNGGTTWAKVPNVTDSTSTIPAAGFAFDPTSLSGGKAQTIYLFSQGSGVWRSTNGGTTFSALAGSPDSQQFGVIASDGVYYTNSADETKVWRFQSSTWTDITPAGSSTACLVVSPFSAATLFAVHDGGSFVYSANRGTTWGSAPTATTIISPDIPWLAVNAAFIGYGGVVMDPLIDGKMWQATGGFVGVSQLGGSGGSGYTVANPLPITVQSNGIEEIVVTHYISPPGGTVQIVNQDRPIMRWTGGLVPPSTYYPTYLVTDGIPIEYGSGADWASSNPNFICLLANHNHPNDNGYSTDGGLTWSRFTTFPANCWNAGLTDQVHYGGYIAAASPSCMIWAQSNKGDIYYTLDGGVTWTVISAATWNANGATGMQNSNLSFSVDPGWGRAAFLRIKTVCADRVLANTFYVYNSSGTISSANGEGLYKVSFPSGVLTISVLLHGQIDTAAGNNLWIDAVPNLTNSVSTSGLIFYTDGGGNSTALFRSFNGGSTWVAVNGTGECKAFGYGAVKPGNNFPSVYVVGTCNGIFGVFRSDNSSAEWIANTVTWNVISTDLPLNSTDFPVAISGDSNIYGRCYLGYGSENTAFFDSTDVVPIMGFSIITDSGQRRTKMIGY